MFLHHQNRCGNVISALLALLLPVIGMLPANAGAKLEGPVPAVVTRVIDGDTIEVRAQIWLEQEILVRVRLAGIDAPEKTAACDEARAAAQQARDLVVREVDGARVLLVRIRGDKYFGRVIGHVVTPKGEDLASLLLAAGLATPYSGGRRSPMC
jgi:micrococcal nuclease